MTHEVTLRSRYRTRSRWQALAGHLWWLLLPKPRWWWEDTWQFARIVVLIVVPVTVFAQIASDPLPTWAQEFKEDLGDLNDRVREIENGKADDSETLGRIDERLKAIENRDTFGRDLGVAGGQTTVIGILLYLLLRRRNGH